MRAGVHRGAGTPGVLLGTHPGRALPSSSVALHTHTHTHRAMEGTAVTGGFFCLNLFL